MRTLSVAQKVNNAYNSFSRSRIEANESYVDRLLGENFPRAVQAQMETGRLSARSGYSVDVACHFSVIVTTCRYVPSVLSQRFIPLLFFQRALWVIWFGALVSVGRAATLGTYNIAFQNPVQYAAPQTIGINGLAVAQTQVSGRSSR